MNYDLRTMTEHDDASVVRRRAGFPATALRSQDRDIVFNVSQLAGPQTIGPHQAMVAEDLTPAPDVEIRLPGHRSKSLVHLLQWLVVHRIGEPGGRATFLSGKQQGPGSIGTLLTDLGWRASSRRRHPAADRGTAGWAAIHRRDGGNEFEFAADYGVFSPGHVEEGALLHVEGALRQQPVAAVMDIGVGYGSLAVAFHGPAHVVLTTE